MPMMAFIGVRISWLTFARKSLLARFAASASFLRRPQFLLTLLQAGDVAIDPDQSRDVSLSVGETGPWTSAASEPTRSDPPPLFPLDQRDARRQYLLIVGLFGRACSGVPGSRRWSCLEYRVGLQPQQLADRFIDQDVATVRDP